MTVRPVAGVVDYDLGNLPSVTKALERAGFATVLLPGPSDFDRELDAVVLPGVGHFGTGARNLAERGLDAPLKDLATSGRPFLGICVGLQLLFERSEEDPEARGLGIVPGEVRRLHAPKVPHMGWNTLELTERADVVRVVGPDRAYFVHSYYVEPDPEFVAATTEYGQRFCSAIERGGLLGVQFHPEKSADTGRRLLERFAERVR